MNKIYVSLVTLSFVLLAGCSTDNTSAPTVDVKLNTQIIDDFSVNVANAEYADLKTKTALLYDQVIALQSDKTDANLFACQQTWKDARKIWEQSEAQLFGPVETDNIDPQIDTWPVNFADLDAQLDSENEFTEDYINGLEDALKGFHPIEYIIFGQDGNKKAEDITDRQLQYLEALALNVKTLTSNLADVWNTTASTSFYKTFSTYTQQDAMVQLVSAMADICGEVGSSKINDVYLAQDPTLEESPFAKSSITDFTYNIKGIQNVYLGKYTADGKGLEDLVKQHNLSLDGQIKTKLDAAISALGKITDPFGEAITSQKTQVVAAVNAINELKEVLNDENDLTSTDLVGFVKLHSK